MADSTLERGAAPPSRAPPRGSARGTTLSNLVAVYGLVLVLLVIVALFGALRPATFLSTTNFDAILVSQSVTAMLALAEMVPLATKQFDLSIGYHLGLAQVLVVGLQVTQHLGWPEAAALILLASLLTGLVNGLLVTVLGIDSFIATMGTGTLLYGVTNWYSNGEQISGMDLPESFTDLTQILHGVPMPAVYVAAIAAALWLTTEHLPIGRNLYVIGANARAAELTGIDVRRHVIAAFATSGLLSGFAGILLGSILQTGTPSVGPEYLLPAFAATLLGATSIKPGRVNVVGTLISVLVLALSFSGVQQLGAPFYVQCFFNGGILVVAVGLSVYAARRRRRAASRAHPRAA